MIPYLDSGAIFSDCGLYRYKLWREWGAGELFERHSVLWVLLNPSTADGQTDDPTIRRVVTFSKMWNYTRATIMNLYAYRATDPRELQRARNRGVDVHGPKNEWWIDQEIEHGEHDLIVGAWGRHGRWVLDLDYEKAVRSFDYLDHPGYWMARAYDKGWLHALGLNQDGTPVHPLYQPYRGWRPPPCIDDFREERESVREWLQIVK